MASLEETFPSGIRCEPKYHIGRDDPKWGWRRDWTVASNGDAFPCASIENSSSGGWIVPQYTSGSDYSGGIVTESNYRVIKEECEKHADATLFYVDLYGGHGTYALAFKWSATPDEIREILIGLDSYPCADEDDLSQLETDQQEEAWENWARADYRRALEKAHSADLSDVTDDDLWTHFCDAADAANEYWFEDGTSQYIQIDRIVAHGKAHGVQYLPGARKQAD